MFITSAQAQTMGATNDMQGMLLNFLPIVLIMFVFYFLLLRPQQQKAKELKQAQAALRRGDRIVTAGGMLGTISRVINDDEIEVQIAEAVKVRIVRSTISTVLAKTEPVASKEAKADDPVETASDADAKKRRTTTK